MVDNVLRLTQRKSHWMIILALKEKDGRIWVQSCPLWYIGCWNTP